MKENVYLPKLEKLIDIFIILFISLFYLCYSPTSPNTPLNFLITTSHYNTTDNIKNTLKNPYFKRQN